MHSLHNVAGEKAKQVSLISEGLQILQPLLDQIERSLARRLDSEKSWKCRFPQQLVGAAGFSKKRRIALDVEKVVANLERQPDAFSVGGQP